MYRLEDTDRDVLGNPRARIVDGGAMRHPGPLS